MAADPFDPVPPSSALLCCICHCGSPAEHARRAEQAARENAQAQVTALEAQLASVTPDASVYSIERVERVGDHLVMQVKYPNCAKCAFEGTKTMVFLNVTEAQAIKWRRIDPHFRDTTTDHAQAHPKDAPSPAVRFPGDADGWEDALVYAKRKQTDAGGR